MNEHLTATVADIEQRIENLQCLRAGVLSLGSLPSPGSRPESPVTRRQPAAPRGEKPKRKYTKRGTAAAANGRPVIPGLDEPDTVVGKTKRFIAASAGTFDMNDVLAAIGGGEDEAVRSRVRGSLAYWASQGKLTVVEKGRPNYPAKLERAAAWDGEGA